MGSTFAFDVDADVAKTLQIFSKKKGAVNGNLRALIICYIICKLYYRYMLSKTAQKLMVIIILYVTNFNYSGLIFSLVLGF